jgi:hypothetical protein
MNIQLGLAYDSMPKVMFFSSLDWFGLSLSSLLKLEACSLQVSQSDKPYIMYDI